MKHSSSFRQASLPTLLLITGCFSGFAMGGQNNWYFKAHGGIAWYSAGKDQVLNYGEEDFDRYTDKSDDKTVMQYGLGIGYIIPLSGSQSLELGVGWYGDAEHEYKGYIDQYGKTDLRDFEYSYKLQTHRFVLEGSYRIPFQDQFEGFVTGGIGIGMNKLSKSKTTRLDPNEESPKPDIKDNTNNSFAWQLGAGISWSFMPDWKASLFYLYANNGKAESSASNASFNNKYETDNITSHNLILSVSHLF